jgi:hypothetical protein
MAPHRLRLPRLFNQTLESLEASDQGVLALAFTTPGQLVVAPQPAVEAWEILAPVGLRLIALPDGQLAKWQGLA